MDEFALIRRYFDRPIKDESVRLGIGDDAALIAPDAERELVSAVDTIVAGIHYPMDLPPFDVGYRAVAINLSDIAAMGGTPRWMTLALTIPESDAAWLSLFAEGLFTAATEGQVSLVGGDTTRGPTTVVSIQILGEGYLHKRCVAEHDQADTVTFATRQKVIEHLFYSGQTVNRLSS